MVENAGVAGEAGLLEKVKLPPGPVQRGPQERVRNASQGGLLVCSVKCIVYSVQCTV